MHGQAMRPDHSPMRLRGVAWRVLAVVILGLAALYVSVTEVQAIGISSSVTGTVALDASSDGMLDVTMTLQPTELELKLVVTTLRRDVAVLEANGRTQNRHVFELASGREDTISYRVKPLANGRATIAWNVRNRNGPVRYHGSGVYQVDITGVATPDPPPAMTTKTTNQVTVREIEADRWHESGSGGGRVDHVIGDNTSVTYAVSLEPDEHGVCLQPATVQISVSGSQEWTQRPDLGWKSELGLEAGDTVTDSSQAIGAGGTLDLSFTQCGAPQLVTAYGVPDSDGWHSKLTLNHTLIQGTPTQRLDGPELKLWVFDLNGWLQVLSYASAYDPRGEHPYTYNHRTRINGRFLYVHARQPLASGEPASAWWEGCTADRDPNFKWERYCPLPPWTPADAQEHWTSLLGETNTEPLPWVEFCMKLPDYQDFVKYEASPMPAVTLVPYYEPVSRSGWQDRNQYEKGRVPPFEFQVYSKVVETEDGYCQPVSASQDTEGAWATFYDGSAPDAEPHAYKIGDVTIPREQFGYFINVRVRGVVGLGKDPNNSAAMIETRPHTDIARLSIGFKEFHKSVLRTDFFIKTTTGNRGDRGYEGPAPRLRTPGDDCSADRRQACAISAPTDTMTPTTATGDIQYFNDIDWFRVSLTQGKRYQVQIAGRAIPGRIHANEFARVERIWVSNSGAPIDTAGRITNGSAGFTFTADTTGVYHIEVEHGGVGVYGTYFRRAHMGGYELKLTLLE